jgi:hypothetical protein
MPALHRHSSYSDRLARRRRLWRRNMLARAQRRQPAFSPREVWMKARKFRAAPIRKTIINTFRNKKCTVNMVHQAMKEKVELQHLHGDVCC